MIWGERAAEQYEKDQPTEYMHQHEAWQIRDSASGGRYCAACGRHISDEYGRRVGWQGSWSKERLLQERGRGGW